MISFIDDRRPASRHIHGRKFTVFIDCERSVNRSVSRVSASRNCIKMKLLRYALLHCAKCLLRGMRKKVLHYENKIMYYIMRKSYYVMQKLLRYAKNVLCYAIIITLCGNYYVMRRHKQVASVHLLYEAMLEAVNPFPLRSCMNSI